MVFTKLIANTYRHTLLYSMQIILFNPAYKVIETLLFSSLCRWKRILKNVNACDKQKLSKAFKRGITDRFLGYTFWDIVLV